MHPWTTERIVALFIACLTALALAVSIFGKPEATTTTATPAAMPTAEVRP